jgi:four helix bundle protein
MRNFRKLEIWNDARFLVKEIYLLTNTFPSSEKFGLISQINRAAISIPANIAEGCAKDSQKDFARFLQISLGSAFEIESHLILGNDIGFITDKELSTKIEKLQLLQKRIYALIKYTKSKQNPTAKILNLI